MSWNVDYMYILHQELYLYLSENINITSCISIIRNYIFTCVCVFKMCVDIHTRTCVAKGLEVCVCVLYVYVS